MTLSTIPSDSTVLTVAYAEDHTAVRLSIINYIHDLGGVRVVMDANNGLALLALLEAAETLPDICMLDIKMPEMDGFELLSKLKEQWPSLKTLVLSTFSEELYVIKMIRAGVNGYLTKDCDPEEIKQALISIHTHGIYYSELFASNMQVSLQPHGPILPDFSGKELQFLKHCCSDLTYAQIARAMKTTPKSAEGMRDSLFKKLKINSRVMLALFAVRSGIVPTESGPIFSNPKHDKL